MTIPEIAARNARVGLVLFFVYFLFYGGFIALVAFKGSLAAERSVGGVNVAILYGLGLIAGALVLAAVYMTLCRGTRVEK